MGRFFEKWVTLLLCSIFFMKIDLEKKLGLLQDQIECKGQLQWAELVKYDLTTDNLSFRRINSWT